MKPSPSKQTCHFVDCLAYKGCSRLAGAHRLGCTKHLCCYCVVAYTGENRSLELESLSTLTRLQDLRLGENLIKGVALPLAQTLGSVDDRDDVGLGGILPNLQVLGLAGNRLADVGDVDKLAVLPGLIDITLAGNPIAKKQVCTAANSL